MKTRAEDQGKNCNQGKEYAERTGLNCKINLQARRKNICGFFSILGSLRNRADSTYRHYSVLVLAALLLSLFAGTILQTDAASVPPTIQVSGDADSAKLITLVAGAGEDIYWTDDGSTPTTSSNHYAAPFTIKNSVTLKTIAHDGGGYSSVTSQDIYAPILLLKSDSGVSTGVGSPQPISSWSDLSTNSNTASSAGSAAPLLKTNAQLDYPGASLDGSSQFFSLPTGFSTFAGASIFVVTRPDALDTGGRIIDLGQGASGNNLLMRITTSGEKAEVGVYNGTGTSSFLQSQSKISSGQFQLLEAVIDSGSSPGAAFYVNGESNTGSLTTGIQNVSRANNYIGQASNGGSLYQGSLAEVLVFSKKLPAAERKSVEALLIQRYQLLSNTPSTPIISVPTSTLNGPTQVVISSEPGTVVHLGDATTTPSASTPVYDGCPIIINFGQTLKAIAIKNGVSSGIASSVYTMDTSQWPATGTSTTAPSITLTLPVQSQ